MESSAWNDVWLSSIHGTQKEKNMNKILVALFHSITMNRNGSFLHKMNINDSSITSERKLYELHEGGCKSWFKTNDHVPTRWPCPSTNRSSSLTLIGWTWTNLLKSLIILLETTKLLLAQSAASFQCAHPFLLSPFPLPTLMNPLCGEIVIQVDYTVNWVMEDWMLWKWISNAAVLAIRLIYIL